MNNEEQLFGVNLERVTFRGNLAKDIRRFRSPEGYLQELFPEIARGEVSATKVLKCITSFYAGMQYAYDKISGKKRVPKIWIGSHSYKGQKLSQPAYHSDFGILLPIEYIIETAKLPDTYRDRIISHEGKYIGYLPLFASVGEGGAEEMTHAIQDQQGKLKDFEEDQDISKPIIGYNKRKHEQEALVIRNSFLSEICDISGFYDDEIIS